MSIQLEGNTPLQRAKECHAKSTEYWILLQPDFVAGVDKLAEGKVCTDLNKVRAYFDTQDKVFSHHRASADGFIRANFSKAVWDADAGCYDTKDSLFTQDTAIWYEFGYAKKSAPSTAKAITKAQVNAKFNAFMANLQDMIDTKEFDTGAKKMAKAGRASLAKWSRQYAKDNK
jgi:hypothetical protein